MSIKKKILFIHRTNGQGSELVSDTIYRVDI